VYTQSASSYTENEDIAEAPDAYGGDAAEPPSSYYGESACCIYPAPTRDFYWFLGRGIISGSLSD
jgi:hypothetical protein